MHFFLPLKVNSLVLDKEEQYLGQDIVFENIPWFNDQSNTFINSLTPYISQSVIPTPFSNDNLISLKKGLHLHWELPSVLKTFDENGRLAEVPNRYFVIKESGDDIEYWIVESDYIWDVNSENFSSSDLVSYPFLKDEKSKDYSSSKRKVEDHLKFGFDFKYVGKKRKLKTLNFELVKSTSQHSGNRYLDQLTAVGWGSLSFNSNYGNCRSMFGFCDENFDAKKNSTYHIIGFYSDSNKDFIQNFIEENRNKLKARLPFLREKFNEFIDLEYELQNLDAPKNEEIDHKSIGEKFDFSKIEKNIDNCLIFDIEDVTQYILDKKSLDPKEYFEYVKLKGGKLHHWEVDLSNNNYNQKEEIETFCLGQFDYNAHQIIAKELESLETNTLAISVGNTLPEAVTSALFKDSQSVHKLVEEEQLEAILNWGDLSDQNLDWTSRLRNKRQENQFTVTSSTIKWEFIRSNHHDNNEDEKEESPYPTLLEKRLGELNILQKRLENYQNKLYHEIESMYIDWHTYLMSLFVYKKQDLSNASIRLILEKRILPHIATLEGKIKEVNSKLNNRKKYLETALLDYDFELNSKTDMSFVEPMNPSILLFSEGNDGKLNLLRNSKVEHDKKIVLDNDLLSVYLDNTFSKMNYPFAIISTSNEWNTYKIDWESLFISNKITTHGNVFPEDFITKDYLIDSQFADLTKKHELDNIVLSQNASLYYGSSFVNDTIKEFVNTKLDSFLESRAMKSVQITDDNNKKANQKYLLDIKNKVENLDFLEINLSDFNNYFMQRSSGLNILPLVPNGFTDHRELASHITKLITKYENKINLLSPSNISQFNPFRNGAFKISRLRIVDTFGRNKIIDVNSVSSVYNQEIENKPNWISLPPRLLQSSNIDGEWEFLEESNSPVLGWMMLNLANYKIEIFNTKGVYLGALNKNGKWESSAFDYRLATDSVNDKDSLSDENIYLNSVLKWFEWNLKGDSGFLESFIEQTLSTLHQIQPENTQNASLLESLASTPLALTKIDLSLSVRGGKFHDISPNSLEYYSKSGGIRSDLEYSKVKIPISVGDALQYNDGCVAYWHLDNESSLTDGVIHPTLYFNDTEKAIYNGFQSCSEYSKSLLYDLDRRLRYNADYTEKESEGSNSNGVKDLMYYLEYLQNNSANGIIDKNEFIKQYIVDGNKIWSLLVQNEVLTCQKISNSDVTSVPMQLKEYDDKSFLTIDKEHNKKSYVMLMHPYGDLFVKSGILPVRKLKLPVEKLQKSLRNLSLTLPTGPILTPDYNLELTLLKNRKYQWSWIELVKQNNKLPIGIKNNFSIKRITQLKSIDLKKCHIDYTFHSIDDLENKLLSNNLVLEVRPDISNVVNSYIINNEEPVSNTIDKIIYNILDEKSFTKRWRKLIGNLKVKLEFAEESDSYCLAKFKEYKSGRKDYSKRQNEIYDFDFFKDPQYVFLKNWDKLDNDKFLEVSAEEAKNIDLKVANIISLDEALFHHINLELSSKEFLKSNLLIADDFYTSEHIYFINEKLYGDFEVFYNSIHQFYSELTLLNWNKVTSIKLVELILKNSHFATLFADLEQILVEKEEIQIIFNSVKTEGEATSKSEEIEIIYQVFSELQNYLVSKNNIVLSEIKNLNPMLLKDFKEVKSNAKELQELKFDYSTFEFLMNNKTAISSIDDFTVNNTTTPNLLLKEGWLSIKPNTK